MNTKMKLKKGMKFRVVHCYAWEGLTAKIIGKWKYGYIVKFTEIKDCFPTFLYTNQMEEIQ